MSIRKKYRAEPHLDMGPFSDVAFLLIIFFIVTTTLVRPMGRLIDIPSATSDKKEAESKNLTVTVMVDKMLFGRDEASQQQTSLPAFRTELATMKLAGKAEKDRMIVVNLEDDVPYESFYEIVTAISQADGIVTLVEEEEEESP